MSTDQEPGPKVDPPVPKKVGRHRRATRRPRITADQVGRVIKVADLLVRTGSLLTSHETPTREWIHYLTGLAVKFGDVFGTWLG